MMLRFHSAQVLHFRSFGSAQDRFWILDWHEKTETKNVLK